MGFLHGLGSTYVQLEKWRLGLVGRSPTYVSLQRLGPVGELRSASGHCHNLHICLVLGPGCYHTIIKTIQAIIFQEAQMVFVSSENPNPYWSFF